ncbi:G-protein coupled receptor GRL101-like [Amphiura filiformis]|uniref:G-protein coupled receptor GRL101-like n=1 Tax=Amphiura filiformis TaxID=82378 RepID=UPI003B21926E
MVRTESANGDLVVEPNALQEVSSLQTLYVDEHTLCCYFEQLENCVTLDPLPPLFNCGSLMQNTLLRVFMWILGISAVLGNLLVIIFRMNESPINDAQIKQQIFIGGLAVSDFLMGIYMLIIASADIYYGESYFTMSEQWRRGPVCKLAGFIGLFASEASVFFITLITLDRFLIVVFTFSKVQFRKTSSKVAVFIIWGFAFFVSVVPILLSGPDSDFYDLSDVCLGLPLITRPSSFTFQSSGVGNQLTFDLPVAEDSKPAWYFSIALFLGVNLLCFLFMLICYIVIFVTIKDSRRSAGRKETLNEEIRMAMKMAAVVGTDFACWFPVIMMGLLSQTGLAVIPLDAYVWSVVFVLPVNSSLNPYLYTIASLLDRRPKLIDKTKSVRTVDLSLSNTNI